MSPAIYTGTLRHRRFAPVRHEFTYRLFMVFLDVDRIPALMRVSPLTAYNRRNLASYEERDHFGDPALSLRERLRADAGRQGISLPDGPVFLLTHLRYLGYVFNPISLYYCYGQDGRVETILAEVNNTFGDSHNYWLWDANRIGTRQPAVYECRKRIHVSPFLPMDLDYRFVLPMPAQRLLAHMDTRKDGVKGFDATLHLERSPWSARSVHKALFRFPWMTARVIGAIHWEALKLYFKKAPFHRRPERPS